ncbi:MAG: phosphatase PAP2 family protein [Erysipelotrichaceae bacterium]|nr:phosphatase PAP2 family protein [Erysipelotrichaceae bacterium]
MLEFELYLLDLIQEIFKNPFFDTIMPLITHLGAMGALPIAIAAVLILRKSTRTNGMKLALALIICFAIVNLGLKPLIARARPFNYRDIALLVGIPLDFSFPSGHSAIFMALTSSLFYSKSRTWPWFLLLALVVGFSRLYLYVHFPSDVIGGFALGWLAGWLSNKLASKSNNPQARAK